MVPVSLDSPEEKDSLTSQAMQPGKANPLSGISFFLMRYRKFETLAASQGGTTPAPGRNSFTSALIWALKALAESQECFTTLELLKATKDEAPDLPKSQTPVLFDRIYYDLAECIMLSPLSTHKSIQETRVYLDLDPRQQHTVTLHFDFTEKPSLPVIEKSGDKTNNIISTKDRLHIDTQRWGGIRSRPPDNCAPLHPQVVEEEGRQRHGETQQNGESNGGSSICPEAARSEHPHRTKISRHAPEQPSPVVRGPVMLKRRGTSPESTSFLWDPSEESEDQCPTPPKKQKTARPTSEHP